MMLRHTPGPWAVATPRPDADAQIADITAKGYIVGTAWGGGDVLDAEQPGNARLIAAAPELFTELRAIVWQGKADWSRARALLDRLDGGQP